MNFRWRFGWTALLALAGAALAEGIPPLPGMALIPVGSYMPLYQGCRGGSIHPRARVLSRRPSGEQRGIPHVSAGQPEMARPRK